MVHLAKILVRSPNWIGDQVMAYPFFHYLREAYPKAKIRVISVPWVKSAQFLNLVDEVTVLEKPKDGSWKSKWNSIETAAREISQSGPWDLGISLPNSFSSAWLLLRSQARLRRGFSTDGRGFLLNQRIAWDSKIVSHRAETYLRLLPEGVFPNGQAIEFWGVPPVNDLDPGVPGVLKRFEAEKAWPDSRPLDPPETAYWVLAPGATAESRRWPVVKFAALARKIYDETGWTGIIVGGPSEAPLAAQLIQDSGLHLLDWTGKGTVTSYWKIFRFAKFSVCNDSGLAHMASLCGSPVQVIWGAGNPRRTEPLGPGKVKLMINPVDCWPCERNECLQLPPKKLDCLSGIAPDSVWNEIINGIGPK